MQKKITKAVFPVAGPSTRFLPATKATPREMLPIVDKPLLQYAVEEAIAGGITELIFITGRNSRVIQEYFDQGDELQADIEAANEAVLLETLPCIVPDNLTCTYVRQSRPLGLGHAVLSARSAVGNHPFAVVLVDDLLDAQTPVLQQMTTLFATHGKSLVGVETIAREHSRSYGVIAGSSYDQRLIKLHAVVEKPTPEKAPSTLGVVGRYVLTPSIFRHLAASRPDANGELQLTDAIASLISEETVLAYQFEGIRYDCGSKLGYLQATVQFALRHPEVREEFRAFLQNLPFGHPALVRQIAQVQALAAEIESVTG